MTNEWTIVRDVVKQDGIVVIPTDTLYGIIASALSKKAVERVYKVRGRDDGKPCIVLITSMDDLKTFGLRVSATQKEFLERVWPGKISVVLPVRAAKWKYLHRGTNTVAFRMIGPKNKNLYKLIRTVGPVIAPSANPQGMPPALKKSEARNYFGDTIDAYICGGTRISKPSTVVSYTEGKLVVLREGAVRV